MWNECVMHRITREVKRFCTQLSPSPAPPALQSSDALMEWGCFTTNFHHPKRKLQCTWPALVVKPEEVFRVIEIMHSSVEGWAWGWFLSLLPAIWQCHLLINPATHIRQHREYIHSSKEGVTSWSLSDVNFESHAKYKGFSWSFS